MWGDEGGGVERAKQFIVHLYAPGTDVEIPFSFSFWVYTKMNREKQSPLYILCVCVCLWLCVCLCLCLCLSCSVLRSFFKHIRWDEQSKAVLCACVCILNCWWSSLLPLPVYTEMNRGKQCCVHCVCVLYLATDPCSNTYTLVILQEPQNEYGTAVLFLVCAVRRCSGEVSKQSSFVFVLSCHVSISELIEDSFKSVYWVIPRPQ